MCVANETSTGQGGVMFVPQIVLVELEAVLTSYLANYPPGLPKLDDSTRGDLALSKPTRWHDGIGK